jgi:hypothetical protein
VTEGAPDFSLIPNLQTLNERFVNPPESALAIQGKGDTLEAQAVHYLAKNLTQGSDESFSGHLAYDGDNEIFYAVTTWDGGSSGALVTFTLGEPDLTYLRTDLGPTPYQHLSFDENAEFLYARKSDTTLVKLNPDGGTEVTTITPSLSGSTIADIHGLAYNRGDKKHVIMLEDDVGNFIIGIIDMATGTVSDSTTLGAGTAYGGLFYQQGLIWSNYGTGPGNFKSFIPYEFSTNPHDIEVVSVHWISDFTSDKNSYKIFTTRANLLLVGALVGVVKIASGSTDLATLEATLTNIESSIQELEEALNSVGTDQIRTDVISSALPTGAATESTLATLATETTLSSVDGKVATAANQSTIQTKLDTLETTLTQLEEALNSVGTDKLLVDLVTTPLAVNANQAGTWDLADITGTVSLPTGAATESTLATLATETTLSSIDTQLGSQATAANQSTIQGKLDTLEATLTNLEKALVSVATDALIARAYGIDGATQRQIKVNASGELVVALE